MKNAEVQRNDAWIHSSCDMCEASCGILVHKVDGVVVKIEGDPACPNSRGKTCSKANAAIMALYDPRRLKTPLKRTNPEKGIGIDPKWAPISWDEALNIVVERLSKVRKEDPRKLTISTFDVYNLREAVRYFGEAFGTPNIAWTVYFCGNYLHSSMYLTNGTFHCDFDAEYCQYLMLFGNQVGFGAGLNPNIAAQTMAEARKRGMRVVVVDPICNNAGSKADEWVPIRPGTDSALLLAMINVLLNDLHIYDKNFLQKYTNAPYLVKEDGCYARENGKPMVWDVREARARPYDSPVAEYALEGIYKIGDNACKPAFQLLKEHVKKYTPEMAEDITTVPAHTIRRLAEEFGTAARVGSNIVVGGAELPYRPVAANIYRGAGAHKHGTAVALSVQILNMIVGAFYVPGGHTGMNIIGPSQSWAPGQVDGLVVPALETTPGDPVNFYTSKVKPPQNQKLEGLFPVGDVLTSTYMMSILEPEKYGMPYEPEVLMVARRNLFLGGVDREAVANVLKKFRFIVFFGTHLDEVSEFADIALPDSFFLEKLQLFPNSYYWSITPQTGHYFWGLRQPVVPPAGEARDWGEVLVEIAERMGFSEELYRTYNKSYRLKGGNQLDPSRRYSREEIYDRRIKSQFGDDKGLEWLKKNGYFSKKRPVEEQYPLPLLKVRFPLYFENYKTFGFQVKDLAAKMGLSWDLSGYEALPDWIPCMAYSHPDGFDLYASNFRVPTHSQSHTAGNAWLGEVARLNPYAQRILINKATATKKGIKQGDMVCVESKVGKVTGVARLTECIHPETVGISSHFGGWAKGRRQLSAGWTTNFNCLLPFDSDHVDSLSAGVDACVRVRVSKV